MAQHGVKGMAGQMRAQASLHQMRSVCSRSHAECVHSCAQLAAGMNTEIHRGATPECTIPGGQVVGTDPADSGIDCKY